MYHRILLAGLVVLTAGMGVRADVYRDPEHRFEANFPGQAKRVTQAFEGGKLDMGAAKSDSHSFAIGAAILEQELSADDLVEVAQGFINGMVNKIPNASVTKEEEFKLSDHAPKGRSFVIKTNKGWLLAWVTIENGKLYIVMVNGNTEESLKDEAVKNFQKSVRITPAAE
jgi:ABC-type sulfate/molybdate transport systems ATPase subunit